MNSIKNTSIASSLLCCLCASSLVITSQVSALSKAPEPAAAEQLAQADKIKTIAIDNVWSGHRIKPHLLTKGKHQFVSYFDANRQMTIAHRRRPQPWRYYKVDSWLGWDSHNYVTLELDSEGYIHVMGNMHADPMEYFRSSEPYKVRSLKRVPVMVDKKLENRMTYPIFMMNKNGELLVKYRDGASGNGNEIYNIYDTKTKSWSRLHANQFLDGERKMSGYFEGPVMGPDGYFHLIWVWRNTPSADTNHSLSYARSADLVSWEDSSGKALALPLTLAHSEVVDPVPPKGGMINGNVKIGFDAQNKPVISYHKYDEKGNTQMHVARREASGWKSVQISDWDGFRWDFSGGGSLGRFAVRPQAPEIIDENTLGVTVRRHDDIMRFVLDAKTLKTRRVEPADLYPPALEAITLSANHNMSPTKGLELEHHVFKGQGEDSKGAQYYLSWHSQPGNRDRAHGHISQPSVLLLHEVKK